MTTTSSGASRTQETASTAVDEGRHVGAVAGEEARNVASEATTQARNLVGEAMEQASAQGAVQRDRLVGTLTTFGDDLDRMAEQSGSSGLAPEVARQAARRARDLGDRLDGREPQDLLDDVRRFARRRPGLFLLGALGAGVVAGRALRGAKEARSSEPTPGLGTAAGAPVETAGPVPPGPAYDPAQSVDPLWDEGRPANAAVPTPGTGVVGWDDETAQGTPGLGTDPTTGPGVEPVVEPGAGDWTEPRSGL